MTVHKVTSNAFIFHVNVCCNQWGRVTGIKTLSRIEKVAQSKNNPIANGLRLLATAIEVGDKDKVQKFVNQLKEDDGVIVVLPVKVAS